MSLRTKITIRNENNLRELYDSYFSLLYNYGRKMGIASDLVEDAIQELFLSVWSKKEIFNTVENQQPYLLRALRNNLIRKSKSSFQTEEVNSETLQIIEYETIDTEENYDIKSVILTLPSRQRELLILKYYEGMDYEEIADIMGMNYQSVRNLYSRAIKNLRSSMKIFFLFYVLYEYITIIHDSL